MLIVVGAFVGAALAIGLGMVLLIGQSHQMFRAQVTLYTSFRDVQGLRPGAPVRLAGVDVGTVGRVTFGATRAQPRIRVTLNVSHEALDRLGDDSTARIGTQGLLGDKLIEVTVGSGTSAPLRAGDTVPSVDPTDLNRVVEQVGDVLEHAKKVAEDASAVMEAIASPNTIANMQGAIASMRRLLQAAEQGPGFVHALFYDPHQARAFEQMVASLAHAAEDIGGGIRKIDAILGATDAEGRQVINNFSRAAKGIGEAAGDLHASNVVARLDRAAGDIADMMAYAKSGQGTLGALIVDPTIYEQLVTVLGGVGRSRLLRALVRYAIARDSEHSVARVVDSEKAQAIKPLTHPPPAPKGRGEAQR
jgi:phospholipid/cholesterol/gamma-HCH transport system substrate-binding protein